MNKKFYAQVFIHLSFCILTVLYFRLNSFLRPASFGALYKEYIASGIVLTVFYLNYFVLYPKLYAERRYAGYLTTVLAVLITASLSEECLVFNQVYEIVKDNDLDLRHYFANQTVLIFFRDSCFFLFSLMICIIHSLIRDKNDLHQYLHTQKHLVVAKDILKNVPITLNIEDITYCQQIQNYAYLYLHNGKKYSRSCTLSALAEDIGPNYSVRISRNIIVMYRFVQSFDQNTVFIQTQDGIIAFNITDYYKKEALSQLSLHVILAKGSDNAETPDTPTIESPEERLKANPTPQTNETGQDDNRESFQPVLSYINFHPDCKGSDIANHFHVSQSTVNRTLKQFRKQGLIEYVGSKKTGGYRAIPPQGPETPQTPPPPRNE